MILFDVNVLVYAFREDADRHAEYNRWMNDLLNSDQPFGYSELVLSGFLRLVTHPRVFKTSTPLDKAWAALAQIRDQPNAVRISPQTHHWDIFAGLCKKVHAKGNIVPDAYLAALAIESGSEWITTDHDFSRFPGLRWRHPLG